MTAFDRALADAVGGPDAGHAFWLAALAKIEHAVARSREREDAFAFHPAGEWGRFTRDLDDALELALTGVEVQQLVNDEVDGRATRRRASIAEILHRRAAAVVARNTIPA